MKSRCNKGIKKGNLDPRWAPFFQLKWHPTWGSFLKNHKNQIILTNKQVNQVET